MYELAEHLHKTVGELADMDPCELTGWKAFFSVRNGEAEVEPDLAVRESGWQMEKGDGRMRWTRSGVTRSG